MRQYWAVIGRIEDEELDSCYTFGPCTRAEALKMFEDACYESVMDYTEDGQTVEEVKAGVFSEAGQTIIISEVLCSAAEIEVTRP